MKLKIVFVLLFLAGSAFSQLITPRAESEFSSADTDASRLTFILSYARPAIAYEARDLVPAPLSARLRSSFSATSALTESPSFGDSPRDAGFHRFAAAPVPAATETPVSSVLDFALPAADSLTQSGSSLISPNQEVFALIAVSTIP